MDAQENTADDFCVPVKNLMNFGPVTRVLVQ